MAVISHFCFDGRDWQGCLQVGRGQRLLTIMERTSLSYFQEESAVLFSFVKRSTHSQKETHTQGRTQRNTCTHTHMGAQTQSHTQSHTKSRTQSHTQRPNETQKQKHTRTLTHTPTARQTRNHIQAEKQEHTVAHEKADINFSLRNAT